MKYKMFFCQRCKKITLFKVNWDTYKLICSECECNHE